MAIFRLPLAFNKNISFFKLMGTGKNGGFGPWPGFHRWSVFTVRENAVLYSNKSLYGPFISGWWSLLGCTTSTWLLRPISGHGTWAGKALFKGHYTHEEITGKFAVLTRATVRLNKLKYFWKHIAPVADKFKNAPGLITSFGIGETPFINQATFSVWEDFKSMRAPSYDSEAHKEVIRKTRMQDWYSEELFVRFGIIAEFTDQKPV